MLTSHASHGPQVDPRLLRLAPDDNVCVAATPIEPGTKLTVDGQTIRVTDFVAVGHKVAVEPIAAGDQVTKYGAPIGSATREITPGESVHTHNMKSDYLPTYTLDGSHPYLKDE